jgi:hypothetical protein
LGRSGAVNGSRPSEARDRVLAQLPPEKQLDVMLRAEKRGPRPDDPDWLLVETMMACAARMEAASPMTEETLAAIVERLERIEQRVDPARLERIEALLRRIGKPATATEPVVSPPVRVLMVVAATIAACVVVVALFGMGEATFTRVLAAFALGASATLGYVALAPRIGRRS